MKKLFALFLIAFALSPIASAHAAELNLTWERSQMQEIEVSSELADSIQELNLLGENALLPFAQSNSSGVNGRTIYRALIPASFGLGEYAVRAVFKDGTYKDLALIRIVEFQSEDYNPLVDPETVGLLSITFFSILAMWGLADGPRSRRDGFDDDRTTYEVSEGGVLHGTARAGRDKESGLISSISLDQTRSVWTITSHRFSPFLSRLISDAGYLQFSLGILVLALPLIGALLGALAFRDIEGIGGITTPSLAITISILLLACFDAGAGFVAAIIFGLCAVTSHRFENIYDIRTYLGLSILWFSPPFIANATRSLRRSAKELELWDRTTDVILGSLITGWAVRNLVIGLDGFAHIKLPLGPHANTIGVVTGVAIAVRYLIEGHVNNRNQYYLAYLSPRATNPQSSYWRLASWFVKGILFLFIAISFLGMSWQLWAALALFLLPQILKVFKDGFPNSEKLFQILPVGLPALLFMTIFGKYYSEYISHLEIDPASASRTLFILAAVPGFILTLAKLFGREPRPGDVRWYTRPHLKSAYRVGGVIFLLTYIALTLGLVG